MSDRSRPCGTRADYDPIGITVALLLMPEPPERLADATFFGKCGLVEGHPGPHSAYVWDHGPAAWEESPCLWGEWVKPYVGITYVQKPFCTSDALAACGLADGHPGPHSGDLETPLNRELERARLVRGRIIPVELSAEERAAEEPPCDPSTGRAGFNG